MNNISRWHVASVPSPATKSDPINGHIYQGWRPCMEWCVETFGGGIGATVWGPGWRYVSEGVFEFRQEQDRTMFLLRWA